MGATTASITTCRDASLIFWSSACTQALAIHLLIKARETPSLSDCVEIRVREKNKSAGLAAATALQMRHQRRHAANPSQDLPHLRSAPDSPKGPAAAEVTAEASLRPQRASALAFFAKISDCLRARCRSTFERWPVTAGLSCCRRELLRIALRAHAAAAPRRKRCERWLEAGATATTAHTAMLTERPPRGRRRDRRAARRLT